MQSFMVLGKYDSEAMKEMGSDRTQKAILLIEQLGGKVTSMYALLGGYDFVLHMDLPDNETAMKASMGLTLLSGISFTTYPSLAVNDFDRIIGEA